MLKQLFNISGKEISYRMASFLYRLNGNKIPPNLSVLVNGSPKTGTTWMLKLVASFPGFRIARGYNFQGDFHRYHGGNTRRGDPRP
jgi:hypothetical protein